VTGAVDHPRPLLRRAFRGLDGPWDFCLDAVGHDAPSGVDFDRSIVVPFAPETPASGIGHSTRDTRSWYRRSLDVEPAAAGERILLHLGAVDREAAVFANGALVGTHVGGYTPFAVDVTDAARRGALEIAVRADDDPDAHDVPRGKQEWREEPHGIWYPRTTGIWRTVWLERVPVARIDDVRWVASPSEMTLSVEVDIAGPIPDGARLRIVCRVGPRILVDDATLAAPGSVARTFRLGDGGIDDRWELTWTPSRPTIIDIDLVLEGADGGTIDRVESYAAMRSVGVEDGRFVLNGRPQFLRLVLDQGYWPETGTTPAGTAALRRDLELTRDLGFNGVRKHQKTEDPRYLALADHMGMLVWAEMPSAYRGGATAAANLLAEWRDVVIAHRGHPSVVAWVPCNESWGVDALAVDPRQRALVEALDAAARALDGTRPVSANDGWETVGGDIAGIHDYSQDPAALARRYGSVDAVDALLRARRADGRLADIDRAGLAGRAPILSEFGGIALGREDERGAWGYDRARDADDLVARYRDLWAAVHQSDVLSGACWTQLTDTYQEVNGLLTFDRTPKAPLDALAAGTRGSR
jgi:hypothetical protein